jgi:hypothetical protein
MNNDTPQPEPQSKNQVIGAFLLNNDLEYKWPVRVSLPGENPGERIEQEFVAVFVHKDPKERAAIMLAAESKWRHADALAQRQMAGEALNDEEREIVLNTEPADVVLLRAVLVRIHSGVLDTNRKDISADPGTVGALMRNQWARVALFRAYLASGRDRDSTGN